MECSVEYNKVFKETSDEIWLEILKQTCRNNNYFGILFPEFPDEDTQRGFVGAAFEDTLKEAYSFYTYMKKVLSLNDDAITDKTRVCDFGCGWGRYIRYFMKDVMSKNILGLDVYQGAIDICKKSALPGVYAKVDPIGVIPCMDESLDMFFAYSVFSHLSESATRHWLEEAHKKLRPGGYVVATTESIRFIDFCVLQKGIEQHSNEWFARLAKAFDDPAIEKQRYWKGEFVFFPTGAGNNNVLNSNFYGETIISARWFVDNYSDKFTLVNFNDTKFFQTAFVLQKL